LVVDARTRREVAIVAAALLLPVPLLAVTAVHLPLPAAVERGLASVAPGGGFDVPIREAMPAPAGRGSTRADQSADSGGSTPNVAGRQAASSTYVSFTGSTAGSRADRPQGGAAEPPETLPPDTGTDDVPGGDSPDAPLPTPPPVEPEPDTPPTIATPAEPPTELAVVLDAGGASTEVEAGADGIDVTVSAGDVLPPTTVPLPPPPALP
jgi:hypothetical protein